MAKTYTAQSVGKNHDYDFSVDNDGKITKLAIKAEVNYGEMGREEKVDVWGELTQGEKNETQRLYDIHAQLFNAHFLSQ